MKHIFFTIFHLSRPRFWIYLAGPFIVGVTAAQNPLTILTSLSFWYSLLWFLIPANIILYGINDLADVKTDILNPKKKEKEIHVKKGTYKIYLSAIGVSFLLLIPLFFWITTSLSLFFLIGFIVLSLSYSLPPIRFKSIPFLDSASNILYAFPGFLGYSLYSPSLPPVTVIVAVWVWMSAMHLFSAIPDITYDKKTNIRTTAVVLGKEKSLILCITLWTICLFLATQWSPLFLLVSFYPLFSLCLLYATNKQLEKAYWYFPVINFFAGALLWGFVFII